MAIFDFSERLEDAFQIVEGGNPEYTSETAVNPAAYVFFWAFFNPGHTGTTSMIEFYLQTSWAVIATPGNLTYTWQIKPSGGAWATLGDAGYQATRTIVNASIGIDIGVYTMAVLMPCEIQLIGTDAADDWLVKIGDTHPCMLRAVGTVP